MKIIILGSSGFIGKALSNRLKSKGHAVLSYTHKNIESTKQFKLPSAEALFHLAANPKVYFSKEHPVEDFKANALGTINVLEACRKSGIKKIIYASTILVYKQLYGISEDSETGYNELSGPYGISKLIGEQYVNYYARKFNIVKVCFRIANPYGPKMKKNIIFDIVSGIVRDSKIKLFFTRGTKTDFIYIDDVVSGMEMALEDKFEGIYNLSGGKGYSTKKLVELSLEISSKRIPVQYGEESIKICVNNAKLMNKGWK